MYWKQRLASDFCKNLAKVDGQTNFKLLKKSHNHLIIAPLNSSVCKKNTWPPLNFSINFYYDLYFWKRISSFRDPGNISAKCSVFFPCNMLRIPFVSNTKSWHACTCTRVCSPVFKKVSDREGAQLSWLKWLMNCNEEWHFWKEIVEL